MVTLEKLTIICPLCGVSMFALSQGDAQYPYLNAKLTLHAIQVHPEASRDERQRVVDTYFLVDEAWADRQPE